MINGTHGLHDRARVVITRWEISTHPKFLQLSIQVLEGQGGTQQNGE
jgi:hypothetical protein